MDILNNKTDLEFFFSSLSKINDRILMLDYDGTLSPFTSDRNKAYPYTGIEEILNNIINADNCRVVIITGRTIDDFLKLIHFKSMPEIWGSHGLEQLTPDGIYSKTPIECRITEGLKAYEDALRLNNLLKYCEMKASSIAVHWRGCSTSEINDINTNIEVISSRIKNEDILLYDFDGGKEIRIRAVNKGVAVNKVLSDSTGQCVAAYLGDDLTDEDAFKQLGQRGLKVLVRKVLRNTLADIWLEPPDELIRFLKKWEITCSNKKPA